LRADRSRHIEGRASALARAAWLRALALAALLGSVLPWARAAEPITKFGVVLLQPSSVLEGRVPSIDVLAEYIQSVEAASRAAVLSNPARKSAAGFIVVAVRPGQKSKVWLDFDSSLGFELSRQIVTQVAAVKPFEARNGPVVFALKVALWDGFESARVAPSPSEWKAATHKAGRQLEIDELVDTLWRE
jgi:hypothetical protein